MTDSCTLIYFRALMTMNTDNREASAAMTDAQRFELLVTSVKDYAIYMLDARGYVASWNAGAQRFKGYVASEIIGRHFSEFYTAEDRAAGVPARALRTALDEGKFEDEGWRVRKDGTRFWASVVVDPIRDDAGELVGFAKITRDISERKATQEALRKSEEQFRLLVQGVTDYAIYMLSPAGDVISWNAGATRIKRGTTTPRDHRPAFSMLLHRRGSRSGFARADPGDGGTRRAGGVGRLACSQ